MTVKTLILFMALANLLHADVPDIDAKTRARLGIETSNLAEVKLPRTIAATATVLDPAPLVALLRQAQSAAETVEFSRKSLDRAEKLSTQGNLVPQKTVETARAQLLTDKAAHRAILDSILFSYGESSSSVSDPEKLLKSEKNLIRLSTRFNPEQEPLTATIGTVTATSLTHAPTADPIFQNLSWFTITEAKNLVPGMTVPATLTLPGEPEKGHFLPSSAIVWHLGHPWIYHESAPEKFERIPAPTDTPMSGGYFITDLEFPLKGIVTTGAQLLLSSEISEPDLDD